MGTLYPGMKRVMYALEEHGDMEADEIAEVVGLSWNTLVKSGYLSQLVEMELIRISKWRRNVQGEPTPTYSFTPGKNAKRPRPYTDAETSRRWKKRVGYRGQTWKAARSLEYLTGLGRAA